MNNTKLVIPSCNDFMSIYGFDCDLYREDLLELYLDENGDSLSFKLSDNLIITINFYPEISIFIR